MDSYVIICGLGNPGKQYNGTRHNVGFEVIDVLADEYGMDKPTVFGKSMMAKGRIGTQKVILMKPLTYMNLSGEAVQAVVNYYHVEPETGLIIISDDIAIPEGHLRIRGKGSAGGHNGLKNIIAHLHTDEFARVRVGVGGKPNPDYDLADYVLGHVTGEDEKILAEAKERAAKACVCIMEQGVEKAMNQFNGAAK